MLFDKINIIVLSEAKNHNSTLVFRILCKFLFRLKYINFVSVHNFINNTVNHKNNQNLITVRKIIICKNEFLIIVNKGEKKLNSREF